MIILSDFYDKIRIAISFLIKNEIAILADEGNDANPIFLSQAENCWR